MIMMMSCIHDDVDANANEQEVGDDNDNNANGKDHDNDGFAHTNFGRDQVSHPWRS